MKNLKKILCSLIFLVVTITFQAQRLSVKDGKIVKDDNPITLRGVNAGNWLLWEGYMMDLDKEGIRSHNQIKNGIKSLLGNDKTKKINQFESDWRDAFITNDDFKEIKNKGFNLVRIPFDYRLFWDLGRKKVKNTGFKYLDRALEYANNNQIYVVFCMHAAPGFQNPDHHSNNPSTADSSVQFWKSDWSNVNIAKKVWAHIANRYNNKTGEKYLAGYDLLNEPVLKTNKSRLLRAYKEMTAEIRKKDKNHLILAEGNFYASDFYDMLERWDDNLVFANHYYGPQNEANPNPELSKIKQQGADLGIPLFCNEFGENYDRWLNDARTDYEIENVSWAFWAWKRQETERAIYSHGATKAWNKITNYLKDKSKPKPTVSETEKGLRELLNKVSIKKASFLSNVHKQLFTNAPIGKYVSLKFGNQYLTSNNGRGAIKFNKTRIGSWERFKVVATNDNKIALLGNNNRYVNSQNGLRDLTCNSRSIGGWEAFEWIEVNGKIALKGFNGKYVSAEGGGNNGVTCNRETALGNWEQFEIRIHSNKNIDNFSNTSSNIYPNPTSNLLNFKPFDDISYQTITVFDLNGKMVLFQKTKHHNINVELLEAGIYVIKIVNSNNIENTHTFIKQ